MEKKIYFLSPLEAEMYERTNESNDPDDVWSGQDLLEYQGEIRKAIEERNFSLKSCRKQICQSRQRQKSRTD